MYLLINTQIQTIFCFIYNLLFTKPFIKPSNSNLNLIKKKAIVNGELKWVALGSYESIVINKRNTFLCCYLVDDQGPIKDISDTILFFYFTKLKLTWRDVLKNKNVNPQTKIYICTEDRDDYFLVDDLFLDLPFYV